MQLPEIIPPLLFDASLNLSPRPLLSFHAIVDTTSEKAKKVRNLRQNYCLSIEPSLGSGNAVNYQKKLQMSSLIVGS